MADFFEQVRKESSEKRQKELLSSLITDLLDKRNWDHEGENDSKYVFSDPNGTLRTLKPPFQEMKQIMFKYFNRTLISYDLDNGNVENIYFVFVFEKSEREIMLERLVKELSDTKNWRGAGVKTAVTDYFHDPNHTLRNLKLPFAELQEFMFRHFNRKLKVLELYHGDTFRNELDQLMFTFEAIQ